MAENCTRADVMKRTWRSHARHVIRKVLVKTMGKPEPEITAALAAAYPFGCRDREPLAWRIWNEEIKSLRYPAPARPELPVQPALAFDEIARKR